MKMHFQKFPMLLVLAAMLLAVPNQGWSDRAPSAAGQDRIAREVRHELVLLPFYGVFDNLGYTVQGSEVTLTGQVTRPVLKSDAEHAVRRIEGVERVNNEIEVLPLSPMDDQIRRAEFRAIYGQSNLGRYAMQAVPSIHIIVKNGHVTLIGAVMNEMDRNIATITAKGVAGVFSVDNNLTIDRNI